MHGRVDNNQGWDVSLGCMLVLITTFGMCDVFMEAVPVDYDVRKIRVLSIRKVRVLSTRKIRPLNIRETRVLSIRVCGVLSIESFR